MKIQKRASKVGFDWNDPALALEKVREEADEVAQAIAAGDKSKIADEIGDLLFAGANVARHLDVDPESATRLANAKFVRRFAFILRELAECGIAVEQAGLERMDALWDKAKTQEKLDAAE